MCGFQSGMCSSRHQSDGFDELIPGLPLSQQHTLTRGRQPIETAPALARLLDPRALNPPALLEAVEQRIANRGGTPTVRRTASRSACRVRSHAGVWPPAPTAAAVPRLCMRRRPRARVTPLATPRWDPRWLPSEPVATRRSTPRWSDTIPPSIRWARRPRRTRRACSSRGDPRRMH
jgi:hypothetical protein